MKKDYEAELRKQFGKNVRRIRKSKKITQAELSKRSGLKRLTISNIELGKSTLLFSNFLRLAIGLDVEPEELMTGLKDIML